MITVMACFRRNTVSLLKYGILIFMILVVIGALYQQRKEISTVVQTKFNSSRSISGFQHVVNVQRTAGALQKNSHVAKSSDLSFCPLTKLSENATTVSTVGQCKRMKPMKGSCQLAQKLFHSRPTANCNHQQHHSMCKIEELSISDYRVKCDTSICHGPLHLGSLQSINGSIQWIQFSNQQEMQDHILLSIHSTNTKKNYGFCYIRCKLKEEREVKYTDDYYYFNGQWEMFWQGYATQLLVLPPQLKLTEDEILDLPFRKTKNVGLFEEVSVNRSCNDLPMFPGAMCICEGHEWSVRNDSDHTLIAEFAVGQLNNELRNQFYLAHPETVRDYGTCQKLIPHRFGNVKESHYSAEGKFIVITKLDLFVRRPSNSFYEEIFYVTVESPVEASESMTLLSYTRMTTYSIFKTCADESVSLSLCVCNLLDTTKPDYTKVPKIVAPPSMFQTETVVAAVDNICLFVFLRRYPSGATFELRNICNKKIKGNFNLQTTNLETSTRVPKTFLLTAGENQFIVVAKQSVIHLPWKWKYEIQYEEN